MPRCSRPKPSGICDTCGPSTNVTEGSSLLKNAEPLDGWVDLTIMLILDWQCTACL